MSEETSQVHVRFSNVGPNADCWDANLQNWTEAAIRAELRKKGHWPERGLWISLGLLEAQIRSKAGRRIG